MLLDYSTARPDGTMGDSSFERGEPDLIALRGVVRGFREALELMPVGSRCYLTHSATVQEGCGS